MLVYHRFGDVVLRFGVRATMLRFPSLLGAAAARLLSLQRHLVSINGFAVRKGVKPLPPFRHQIRPSADHAGDFVAAA